MFPCPASTGPASRPFRAARPRSGFTLLELLAVITVIAILAGLLVPVLFRSLGTAEEFTITNELVQLEREIENFKIDYGFYPPTIGPNANYEVSTVADMRRYLNRISPNHAEGDGSAGTRLGEWWAVVGSNLDERTSLVFWLSGLSRNKQFPLSGFAGNDPTDGLALKPFNVSEYTDGSTPVDGGGNPIQLERDARFDFDKGRLVELPIGVAYYNQPAGDDSSGGDIAFRYLDFRSYAVGAYTDGTNFIQPDSFQLIGFGMDGKPGNPGNVFNAGPDGDDNIVSFSDGRLDKYVLENQ